jgi:hypothetical protein
MHFEQQQLLDRGSEQRKTYRRTQQQQEEEEELSRAHHQDGHDPFVGYLVWTFDFNSILFESKLFFLFDERFFVSFSEWNAIRSQIITRR